MFKAISTLFDTVTSSKKVETYHASINKNLKKSSFPAHFGKFLSCEPQNKNFYEKSFCLYAAVTSYKKFKKSTTSICYKTYKIRFGSLFAQKFHYTIFPEKSFESILNLDAAELSCKNKKSFMHL